MGAHGYFTKSSVRPEQEKMIHQFEHLIAKANLPVPGQDCLILV
jgi:hypothetical protein